MKHQDVAHHSQAKRRAQWLALVGLWLLVSLGILLVADKFARNQAMRTAASEASTDAELKIALLNVALERPRAIPLVLSGDPDLATALDGGGAPAIDRLNRKLEGLIEGTQSSVIYVTGPTGLTIASSNWRQADSFVGSNYAFREYFQAAMNTGMSEHYALGNVSRFYRVFTSPAASMPLTGDRSASSSPRWSSIVSRRTGTSAANRSMWSTGMVSC